MRARTFQCKKLSTVQFGYLHVKDLRAEVILFNCVVLSLFFFKSCGVMLHRCFQYSVDFLNQTMPLQRMMHVGLVHVVIYSFIFTLFLPCLSSELPGNKDHNQLIPEFCPLPFGGWLGQLVSRSHLQKFWCIWQWGHPWDCNQITSFDESSFHKSWQGILRDKGCRGIPWTIHLVSQHEIPQKPEQWL